MKFILEFAEKIIFHGFSGPAMMSAAGIQRSWRLICSKKIPLPMQMFVYK